MTRGKKGYIIIIVSIVFAYL